jgi:hypothetical protein
METICGVSHSRGYVAALSGARAGQLGSVKRSSLEPATGSLQIKYCSRRHDTGAAAGKLLDGVRNAAMTIGRHELQYLQHDGAAQHYQTNEHDPLGISDQLSSISRLVCPTVTSMRLERYNQLFSKELRTTSGGAAHQDELEPMKLDHKPTITA